MEIYLARTQGFCAGVARAIQVVEMALLKYGAPLYVLHEIVHNTSVVEDFREKGVIFVEDLNDVPSGAIVIFSAHGVPPSIFQKAQERNLKFIDATCPLVQKVHKQALKLSKQKIETILIGHKQHQEMIGTAGYGNPELLHIIQSEDDIGKLNIPSDKPVGYLTQTTLSVSDTEQMIEKLKVKFPSTVSMSGKDICYATQNRQKAIIELTQFCDMIIVCGSPNSSNSNRLREIAQKNGVQSILIDTAGELDLSLLESKERIGISSGASVPCVIVDEVINKIKKNFSVGKVNIFENTEKNIVFALPKI